MPSVTITETQKLESVRYDWGALKWVCDSAVTPGCEQSFGYVHLMPGKTNPLHWHTAAEEIVYVLSGECDITLDGQTHRLSPGFTLRIPSGVRHTLTNKGWEPFIYVASFSAAMRGTMFEQPDGVGARPLSSRY